MILIKKMNMKLRGVLNFFFDKYVNLWNMILWVVMIREFEEHAVIEKRRYENFEKAKNEKNKEWRILSELQDLSN